MGAVQELSPTISDSLVSQTFDARPGSEVMLAESDMGRGKIRDYKFNPN